MSARIRLLTVAAVLAQAALLYLTLKHMVAPQFGYAGLTYRDPVLFNYAAMIVVTIVVALLLPRRIDSASSVILWIVFTFTAAPSIQIPQYIDLLDVPEATRLGVMVAVGLVIARAISSLPPLMSELTPPPVSPATLGLILTVSALIVYGAVLLTTGFNLGYLSFDSVYTVRAEFVAESADSRIIGYGLPVVQNVINPLLMGIGLLKRRPLLIVLAVVGQLAIYSTVGTKNTLFSILFVLAIAPLAHRRMAGALIPLGITVASTAAAVVDILTNSLTLTILTTRRVMIVPGALTAAWVSVFDVFPRLHFLTELRLGDPPLVPATKLVGRIIVNDATTSANVSMFGHGYAQFGYAGLIVECVVFGLLLRLADWSTNGLPTMLAAALFIMPAQAISEASIFTAITTHGFLFAAVIAALLPRHGWEPRSKALPVRRYQGAAVGT